MTSIDAKLGEYAEAEDATPRRTGHTHQLLARFGKNVGVEAHRRPRLRQDDADIEPGLEAVRLGERMKPLGSLRRCLALAPLVMDPGHVPVSEGGRHRVPELLGETVGVANRGESLVRVAEQPAVHREVIPAAGAGIVAAVGKCVWCVPIPIIESDPTLGVRDDGRRLPHRGERRPQRMMRLEQSTRVVPGLRGDQ